MSMEEQKVFCVCREKKDQDEGCLFIYLFIYFFNFILIYSDEIIVRTFLFSKYIFQKKIFVCVFNITFFLKGKQVFRYVEKNVKHVMFCKSKFQQFPTLFFFSFSKENF